MGMSASIKIVTDNAECDFVASAPRKLREMLHVTMPSDQDSLDLEFYGVAATDFIRSNYSALSESFGFTVSYIIRTLATDADQLYGFGTEQDRSNGEALKLTLTFIR